MSHDVKIPRTPGQEEATIGHDAYKDYELPVEGFKGTADEVESQWYRQCFIGRGDTVKQLTWRAVIMGWILGGVLSLTNIYVGLKAGWAFGVAITACILSYAVWTGFHKVRLARTQMTILENNCMQSTASAAGYSTGGTLISAFSAYLLLNDEMLPFPLMLGWVFFVAVLGVTMAVPMKRQMINIEQLRFPSGIAAAETLRALHAKGEKGMRAARALAVGGLFAAVSAFFTDGLRLINPHLESLQISSLVGRLSAVTFGPAWVGRTVTFAWDPIFIAAGMFVGMRVGVSMLVGSVTCWMIFVPWLQAHVPETSSLTGFRSLVQWTLWAGTACMVTSGILAVLFQWRSALRAFQGLGDMLVKRGSRKRDELAGIETPASWFALGQLVSLIALALLAHASFGMPYWQSFVAVLLSFALALVACRVTGETDTTPVGAMGKITQLTFGALSPGNMNVNLMAANITAGSATSSADLLTDLKSGYLLGAHPRK
ncbi:MAG: OPT family oligopeptide transporter, partial [Candidatus Eisenbacteria bacterium]